MKRLPAPPLLRLGMVVVLLQCVAMAAYIVSLLVAQFGGGAGALESTLESDSGAVRFVNLGTAIFLGIIFGFIAWVAVQTLTGKPKGQGAILLIEAIFVGVAIYMFRGGAPWLGGATLISAAIVLVCLLHPTTRQYEEAMYAERRAS